MDESALPTTRRAAMLALLGLVAPGCGGGGSSASATPALAGSLQRQILTARSNATDYPLNIYLPPNSAADRAALPVIYLLDGESRFQAVVDILEATHARAIVVGIGNEAQRGRDYVPANLCTGGGGGQAAYFDFIRLELAPYVEATLGGDPSRRVLLGHSHGGSFVLYALFTEPAAGHFFKAYLASDASIGCMRDTVFQWESTYAAANPSLPVRLHISYSGNADNEPFAATVQARNYPGLTLQSQFYSGGHIGMIPAAFADALALGLAA